MQAIIFDLDGVLCTTDKYHYEAWKTIADELGVYFDEIVNNRLRGVSRMDSLEIILEKYDRPLTREQKSQLAEQKNEIYRSLLENLTPANVTEGALDTLNTLRGQGYLLAVGSSSKNAPFILERLGLGTYFDAVSDGNNISRSKPDPEVFVKAAEMLGVEPEQCLVVEDALAGAEAARRGGMKVACVGDAAAEGAGDWNMKCFSDLLSIVEQAG